MLSLGPNLSSNLNFQATSALLGVAMNYYPEDVEVERKDRYLKKRKNLEKLLTHAGNENNPKLKRRGDKNYNHDRSQPRVKIENFENS